MDFDTMACAMGGEISFQICKKMTLEEYKKWVSDGTRRIEDAQEDLTKRWIEELMELGKAALDMDRIGKGDFDDKKLKLTEEIADVLWVIGGMMEVYEISDDTVHDMCRLKEFVASHSEKELWTSDLVLE